MMSSDSLPEEIIFNILTRLPVKSICRFKCVSKSWLSTISTPRFVKSHFDRSRSHPKLLISVTTFGDPFDLPDLRSEACRKNLFIADRQETEQEKKGPLVLRHQATVPVNAVHSPDSLTVAGLTLSLDYRDLSFITNPITKASVAFPRQSGSHQSVCFGFDPVEGKHKILESTTTRREFPEQRMDYRVVYVSDSGNWRSVEGPVVSYVSHEVCIDGVIYSGGRAREGPCIVAFDVRSEKFKVAKLSINGRLSNPTINPYRYIELEGKLAIVDYPLSNRDVGEKAVPALDVWVLEDFENEVWSLKFSCLPSFSLTRMLIGTTIDGELIFVEFKIKGEPYFLGELGHYLRIVNFRKEDAGEDEVGQFTLYFFNMKTGNFWSKQVDLPPEYHLKGEVRISAATLVERL